MSAYREVIIRNATKGTLVADRGLVAQSLVRRILGLHLLPRLEPGQGLLLTGATTIDTTFMRYPIDLVFLDRSGRVTRVVPALPPWRMVLRTAGGRDCLELPAGTAQASGTQPGDQLVIEDR
ncbi:MAG TPA: DUF192 domain-containing protein [candidate division Zixibacteria bacterium]|nr:DUF192 domain-containing protein [candidate division Zixibacteria bacterium]